LLGPSAELGIDEGDNPVREPASLEVSWKAPSVSKVRPMSSAKLSDWLSWVSYPPGADTETQRMGRSSVIIAASELRFWQNQWSGSG